MESNPIKADPIIFFRLTLKRILGRKS